MVRGKPSDEVKNKIEFNTPTEFMALYKDNYIIHTLLASHMENEKCYIYVVEKGGKRILFGNDSGYYPDETFEYLKGMHLDLAFLDCTYGLTSNQKDSSHMDFSENINVKVKFYKNGTSDDSTVFVSHHFAHVCNSTHEELCKVMEKNGFTASFDGMVLEI